MLSSHDKTQRKLKYILLSEKKNILLSERSHTEKLHIECFQLYVTLEKAKL